MHIVFLKYYLLLQVCIIRVIFPCAFLFILRNAASVLCAWNICYINYYRCSLLIIGLIYIDIHIK